MKLAHNILTRQTWEVGDNTLSFSDIIEANNKLDIPINRICWYIRQKTSPYEYMLCNIMHYWNFDIHSRL